MTFANRANRPFSSRGMPSRIPLAIFFGMFFLIGGALLYFVFLRPAMQVLDARSWTQRPCRIVSSQVGEHFGKKGRRTYSADIVFAYSVGGRRFTSSHYQFMEANSGSSSVKEAIVERYPRGRRTVCYVNPADPADAVIERGFTQDMLVGLVPLLFSLVGAVGIYAVLKRGKPVAGLPAGIKTWALPGTQQHVADFGAVSVAPLEVKPAATRLATLGFVLFFAVFWNGLVSVFGYHTAEEWRNQHGAWFLTIFLVPFVLVGVATVVMTIWTFLQLFDPRVHLRLTPGALQPGRDFALEWEVHGGRTRLSQLRIAIECREEASYPGNKDGANTARAVCYTTEWVNTQAPGELAGGRVTGRMPKGLMHSLNTGRNRIAWVVRVTGKVPRWTGIKDEYPVVMLPECWKAGR